jgi:ribosomal protein RSM22 (predicted rRNA methylase)
MFQTEPTVSEKTIATSILKLSDFYINYPEASTPWDEEYCQIAYRYYFLPLNYQRNTRVIQQGQQVHFFENLSYFIDWGCGPATASLALQNILQSKIQKQILIDRSKLPFQVFNDFHQNLVKPEKTTEPSLQTYFDQSERTCLVLSYSLTEVEKLPKGWEHFEALMILEPSTSEDGRNLISLRADLIKAGFSIWAPCTHHLDCPLLAESKSDWCHDRVHVEAPDWFWSLDSRLPMKNKTITTSYLLARKKKPQKFEKNIARLTGDSREEKGKTRQLVCRSEKREFLTWMHKTIDPQVFPRGELVRLPEEIEAKANELRLQENCELVFNKTC